MMSVLLLLQYACQNIALLCCALFAGAATYVGLVEHPAIGEGGVRLMDIYLLTSHPRPAVLQISFGLLGAATAIMAGLAGQSPWWFGGGCLLLAAALVHAIVVVPLTRALVNMQAHRDAVAASGQFRRLTRLHGMESLLGLTALSVFIIKA